MADPNEGWDQAEKEHDCDLPKTAKIGQCVDCDVCGASWDFGYNTSERALRWNRLSYTPYNSTLKARGDHGR